MLTWRGIKIISEPASEPVSVSEVKTLARIDGTAFDAVLLSLIKAARQAIQQKIRRTLINTTYELYYDGFPRNFTNIIDPYYYSEMDRTRYYNNPLELLFPPLVSVASVIYKDINGNDTSLDGFIVDDVSAVPRIVPAIGQMWPLTAQRVNAVKITYTAGYGASSSNVPGPIRQAIIMLAADIFNAPEANTELKLEENRTYKFLLAAYTLPAL